MKFKIVSGGQTGVDRAGLEAAISLGLPVSGRQGAIMSVASESRTFAFVLTA